MHITRVCLPIQISLYSVFCFIILVPMLSGCTSSSAFSPYPFQITEIKADIESLRFADSLEILNKKRRSDDKTLYMLERARVAQLGGDLQTSIEDFSLAMQNEAQADDRARISLTETAAKGVALVSSDNVLPFRASSYERVLMHHYQAMNYLAENKLEAAGVEIRRASLEQKEALERHHKELVKADEQARKQNYNSGYTQSQVDSQFRAMYAAAGNVKNSFQNAYTFYFSGVIWEMMGEENDAYIDYRKALEIFPDNTYLQKDVLRLSDRLGFRDEYDLFSKKFAIKPEEPPANSGEIVILYEEGYVPVKEEAAIHVALPTGFHSLALPFYRDITLATGHLSVSEPGGTFGSSEQIVDVRALAIKDLQEKMPGIVIRQVLRIIAKDKLQQTAKDQLGTAGEIFSMVYSVVSESADRRSWLTLPRNAQVFRSRLTSGEHELNLSSSKNARSSRVKVNIRENKISVLHVVATRDQLFVRQL